MKLTKVIFPFLALSGLFLFPAFTDHSSPPINITGLWADSNSTNFSHCYAIFSQEGNKVKVAHYLEFKGTPMVEIGEGNITGNKVDYKVKVTKAIPGWALSGEHILELSPDGNTLRGIYKDEQGNTGPMVFKKLRP
ncbi:hypothetical protein C3K47_04450 [Solitalea longa]|uniref:Lipocalin-like domain-containing protein n=1 Tax=Solitalea longa TaxID=2079460 RepID=A0A2S5A648_9SPHI|nr:hypothetical protein [Solitalea longa]POY37789.1 hypothetical protein C3K47_04450 [Solitalea longa]